MDSTDIQKYYTDKNILITGATGFVGKAIVEKLLRSCANLNNIILLIRSKKGETFENRIANFFNNNLFDKIKESNQNVFHKVLFIESNLGDENLGLNENNYNFIINSVNIIIHCAATVHFNGPLHNAIFSNIICTKNMIELAKNIQQLEAFVHVSTLWSHATIDYKPQRVIHNSYDPEFLIHLFKNVDKDRLRRMTPSILGNWPNTYLLTKHATEVLIDREKERLPVVVFRVPGVGPIYYDPIPGWVNEAQGITALGTGLASGLINVLNVHPELCCDILPADYIVNCIIAAAWFRANQNGNELKVYNFGNAHNIMTRKKYFDCFVNTKYPLECTVWTPGYTVISSEYWFNKFNLIYQTIPARIWDFFRLISFQKLKYTKIVDYNNRLLSTLGWFFFVECNYEFESVPFLWNKLSEQDKKLFYFDVQDVDWDDYLDLYCKTIKLNLKEDFNNLHKCEVNRYLLKCKY